MTNAVAVAFRDLSQPESTERSGQVVSAGTGWIELELTDGGGPVRGGTLAELRTSQTIYLGHVENAVTGNTGQTVRVRIEHSLALQDVSSIQKLWSPEQRD